MRQDAAALLVEVRGYFLFIKMCENNFFSWNYEIIN